jgi:hypothetical protein
MKNIISQTIEGIKVQGSDMTKDEYKLLKELLWKEMSIYGNSNKNDYQRNCVHTVWSMVNDILEEEG